MNKTVVIFVVGGVVGATLGLLFAPRSGTDTRAMIAERLEDSFEEAKDRGAQVSESLQETYGDIKDKVEPVFSEKSEELLEKINAARDRIKEQLAKATDAAQDIADVVQMPTKENKPADENAAPAL